MQFQRICAPAFRRARVLAGLSGSVSLSTLNAARRAMGAGPVWGRPAAAVLVAGYALAVLLAARAGAITSPTDVLLAGGGTAAVLAVAASWSRGVDFNAWLAADPRHRRGSCQWLIWRGEQSGTPCLACLASMPARERRTWLDAASSPAVLAGWIGASDESRGSARAAAPARDAGAVRAGWLAWQLLPVGCLATAIHHWISNDPVDQRAALPLALAAVLTAAVNLFLRPGGPARADASNGHRGALAAGREPGPCDSCERAPGTVTVRFGDGVRFVVCAGCLAGGVHATQSGPARAGGVR